MFITDLEIDWNVGQGFDLNGRVFRHITLDVSPSLHPRCTCLPFRLFSFVLWLECIALTGNGVCPLHGCISLKCNEPAWPRWFQILSATGKGLTSRHRWKRSISFVFFLFSFLSPWLMHWSRIIYIVCLQRVESCGKCSNSSFLPLTTVNRYFLVCLIPDLCSRVALHKKKFSSACTPKSLLKLGSIRSSHSVIKTW